MRHTAVRGRTMRQSNGPHIHWYFSICFAGYLFPRINNMQQEQGPPEIDDEDILSDRIEMAEESASQLASPLSYEELVLRVRDSSPRSILRLTKNSRVSEEDLVRAFTNNFGYVIENSGYGRIRSMFELTRWCQDMGLSAYARSCGILLPHDGDALEWLGRQTPSKFPKYLYECRRAEPRRIRP